MLICFIDSDIYVTLAVCNVG